MLNFCLPLTIQSVRCRNASTLSFDSMHSDRIHSYGVSNAFLGLVIQQISGKSLIAFGKILLIDSFITKFFPSAIVRLP